MYNLRIGNEDPIRSSLAASTPIYSLFHTHTLVPARQRPNVLAFSYTFARPGLPAPQCTRFFIHIRPSPARQRPNELAFSYTFARPGLPAPPCTRFFIHIRSSRPASAPMYSLFQTHSLVPGCQRPSESRQSVRIRIPISYHPVVAVTAYNEINRNNYFHESDLPIQIRHVTFSVQMLEWKREFSNPAKMR
jgi:hypothetical protein